MKKVTAKTKNQKIVSFLAQRIGSDPLYLFDAWWSKLDKLYVVKAYAKENDDDQGGFTDINIQCSGKTLRDAMYKIAMVMDTERKD